MFGNLLCCLGLHRWNSTGGHDWLPDKSCRVCSRCKEKQVWILNPLWMVNDMPMGYWEPLKSSA